MNPTLDLKPEYLTVLQEVLQRFVPDCDVWAYGSRVHGQSHDASDLDLVVYRPGASDQPVEALANLQEELVESQLPILVQVMDWSRIPESFRQEIQRGYIVVQTGK